MKNEVKVTKAMASDILQLLNRVQIQGFTEINVMNGIITTLQSIATQEEGTERDKES